MSATKTPPNETDTQTTIDTIEQYLIETITDSHAYFNSREIAEDLGLKTRKVATLLSDVDEQSDEINIEKWAYTRSTTWLIEKQPA